MRRASSSRLRTAAAAGLAAVTLFGTWATSPAGAAPASPVAEACPLGRVPSAGFGDVADANVHHDTIDCLVWWGVTKGVGAGSYGPEIEIPRGQLATMLTGLVKASGKLPGSIPAAGFVDVPRGGTHTPGIDAMAHLGVVDKSAARFNPGATVTRAQMATMLVGLVEKVFERPLAEGATFPDIAGNVHAANIRKLVGAGITSGTAQGTYDPNGKVKRAQMASFVMRSADVLVRADQATPPPAAGSPTDYSQLTSGGRGFKWNPCTPIRYQINATRGKARSAADARAAIARIAAITGHQFVDEGSSTVIPQQGYGAAVNGVRPPLLIAWADAHETDVFDGAGGAVGIGGPSGVGGTPFNLSLSGHVVIRASADKGYADGFAEGASGELLMHELGHVMGLGHADGDDQIMYFQMSPPSARSAVWGAGDLAGLRLHGRSTADQCTLKAMAAAASAAGGDEVAPELLVDLGPEA